MPRQPRLHVPGLVHHVMGRGVAGCEIFRDDHDREGFLNRLAETVGRPEGPYLYAWALLTNHFHLLLRAGEKPLSKTMARLMTGHAVAFNRRHKRKGHLFQNRYKSILVEEEPYFLELVRYIHLNPVRCGIAKELGELNRYRYSGHAVIMGLRNYNVQKVDEVLTRFSKKRRSAIAGYADFIAAGINQGRREELRGGGLARSAGGIVSLLKRGPEEREPADERILGSGGFVEAVLQQTTYKSAENSPTIDEVLEEVVSRSGVSRENILGASRVRGICRVRRQFLLAACERAGASIAILARITGRSHVTVRAAIEQAKTARHGDEITQ